MSICGQICLKIVEIVFSNTNIKSCQDVSTAEQKEQVLARYGVAGSAKFRKVSEGELT